MDSCEKTRVSRTTMFAAVILAVMMLGLPSFAEDGDSIGIVGDAAALDDVNRLFRIGTSELAIATLNVFEYTMADEYTVIWLCMSTLLTYDVDLNIKGDLAKSWESSDDGLTWTFEIVDNAYFCNPDDPTNPTERVTVNDIIWTYNAIQDYKSNMHFYFPGPVDGPDMPPTISEMIPDGDYKLTIVLDHPFAPFVGAIATIPILPAYYWDTGGGNPTNLANALPIGCGPFYYDLDGLPEAGEAVLKRNPNWFQEENRGWQIHVDELRLVQTTDQITAWNQLVAGEIDCMMGVPPSVFVEKVDKEENVVGFAASTGFVYEFNLNQLTDEMREELGWTGGPDAYNSPILRDPVVKKAFAKCINKEKFIEDVLLNLGTYADSLIPDVNPWYHRYDGDQLVAFDPAGARADLMAAGWNMDAAGNDADPDQCPLYGYFEVEPGVTELLPLDFRFLTLTEPEEWLVGAELIMDWCELAGIRLNLELKSSNQMNTAWYTGSYDTWLWDWMFTPLSDPSVDVLSVLTTMEIGSWSDVYTSIPEFDALYNASLSAMDPVVRQSIVNEMQDIAYEDFSCQCIAYRKELYAVNTDKWRGYGNWSSDFMLMPDQGMPYVYMMMSPSGPDGDPPNAAPTITSLDSSFEGYVGEPITFSGSASDTSTLNYRWFWGDGNSSEWLESPGTTWTYDKDGYYEVYFAAKEVSDEDTPDYFISWKNTTVKVIDVSNTAPHSLTITMDPTNPDTGDVVTFTGGAVDDNDDELSFSWSFGDVYASKGQVVEHQYMAEGTYTVTMYVDDDHVGLENRPVSTNALIAVSSNSPPMIEVPDFSDVVEDVPYDFTVTASDDDVSDDLTFTWEWGDGTEITTDIAEASHTYASQGVFTLTVYADDNTGVVGHNVSDTGQVTVTSTDNTAPTVISLVPSKSDPYTGQEMSFTGTASDADGDALKFTFAFGDDTYAVFDNEETDPDTEVGFTVTHTYSTAGVVSAYLYVWDYQDNTSSSAVPITVVANAAPLFADLPYQNVLVGEEVEFSVDPYDSDGDDMTVWWDFGDESDMVEGTDVTHVYDVVNEDPGYICRVYVDDGIHNVTKSAIISVLDPSANLPPEITALMDKAGLVHDTLTFNVTVTDPNDDELNYTWDFGDETDLVVGENPTHAYTEVGVYTFTVYVDDGRGENVSESAV
ncbi:MAG: PKD domain-containing protein, partial [Thermoplasmata archaeon]|nr:PKD domain-containing protein [Thermoplasmata archaeon]